MIDLGRSFQIQRTRLDLVYNPAPVHRGPVDRGHRAVYDRVHGTVAADVTLASADGVDADASVASATRQI